MLETKNNCEMWIQICKLTFCQNWKKSQNFEKTSELWDSKCCSYFFDSCGRNGLPYWTFRGGKNSFKDVKSREGCCLLLISFLFFKAWSTISAKNNYRPAFVYSKKHMQTLICLYCVHNLISWEIKQYYEIGVLYNFIWCESYTLYKSWSGSCGLFYVQCCFSAQDCNFKPATMKYFSYFDIFSESKLEIKSSRLSETSTGVVLCKNAFLIFIGEIWPWLHFFLASFHCCLCSGSRHWTLLIWLKCDCPFHIDSLVLLVCVRCLALGHCLCSSNKYWTFSLELTGH